MDLANIFIFIGGFLGVIVVGYIVIISTFYRKVTQGKALVRTGFGETRVSLKGMYVVPLLHNAEVMDISLKLVSINRQGKDGLICKDNLRADIKVAFFVRVSPDVNDIQKVAQTIGCARASDPELLNTLFEAKFSEALKTVGKGFDFIDLYNTRDELKREILQVIGEDLNGYSLDDAAIDYLEQTPIEYLDEDNILDAEGIKKIRDLTAMQITQANKILREKEKEIRRQDVEAQEAILQLDRQLIEKEEIQKREIATIKARELAESKKVEEEELKKSEKARIEKERELEIDEQNKQRDVLVALKNKERTEAIATADRQKRVAITLAEQKAEEQLVEKIKAAQAGAEAAELLAKKRVIEANAEREAVDKEAEAKKIMADAIAEEHAALGLAEARVMEAEAQARQKEGEAEANVLEQQAVAEAKGIELRGDAQAEANEKLGFVAAKLEIEKGLAEAQVREAKAQAEQKMGTTEAQIIEMKGVADAKGVAAKAEAMKRLDGVGKEHEEFKLRLEKEKAVDLAKINIQESIAQAQAQVLAEALKSANIDIVGGDQSFFDKITHSITQGKYVDRLFDSSDHLSDLKQALLNGNGNGDFGSSLRTFISQFNLSTEDIKNLTSSALIFKMMDQTKDSDKKGILQRLLDNARQLGIADKTAEVIGLKA